MSYNCYNYHNLLITSASRKRSCSGFSTGDTAIGRNSAAEGFRGSVARLVCESKRGIKMRKRRIAAPSKTLAPTGIPIPSPGGSDPPPTSCIRRLWAFVLFFDTYMTIFVREYVCVYVSVIIFASIEHAVTGEAGLWQKKVRRPNIKGCSRKHLLVACTFTIRRTCFA